MSGKATKSGPTALFLHGLDSSVQGTKGRWFARHYPEVLLRNYDGDLKTRLDQLEHQVAGRDQLILVGSSFGGLMAASAIQSIAPPLSRGMR